MTSPTTFNIEDIKRVFSAKGYRWFDNGDLNIIGIRNTTVGLAVTDAFDDWMVCIYKDGTTYRYFQWAVTTDPAARWQQQPPAISAALGGTARLKPGQYAAYKIDKHANDPNHWALCQRAGNVTVFRSSGARYAENKETTGWYGINIHRHFTATTSELIRGGSQGCQVFKRREDFNQLMTLAYAKAGGRTASGAPNNPNKVFTYTLLLLSDLRAPYPQTNRSMGELPPGVISSPTGPNPSNLPNTPGVSPYIATLESLHPFIQYELTRRRNSAETANVYMPFVKLTSLTKILKSNLSEGSVGNTELSDAYCPSLGIHGELEVSFEDIYYPKNNRSIVGYASQANNLGIIERVPVVVEDATKDPPNIPSPGIVSVQTERSTAGPMGVRGGLFKATLNIRAYSVGQVDTLLRYFLRPATRVVLELGRKSSNVNEEFLDGDNKYFQKFNWKRPLGTEESGDTTISGELGSLVTLKKGQRDFIEKYIYGNFGNYEIFIGYVVKFDLKFTKDNSYDIVLTIHSLQQYEVPVTGTGVNSLNPTNSVNRPCDSVDIEDYFNPPSSWRRNTFKKLMTTGRGATDWAQHVIPLTGPGTNATSGGAQSPGYLVSWQFFVDVLLNDMNEGILSVFQLGEDDQNTKEFLNSSVIKPIVKLQAGEKTSLNSNEVSWSPSLRSVDPNVMVIYNPSAQRFALETNITSITSVLQALGDISEEQKEDLIETFNTSNVKTRITQNSPIGSFSEVNNEGTSYLTNGVWINTNAIINAFSGADTISTALNNLLTAMNNATRGFWNLQLLSNDLENPGMHVVDAGASKRPKSAKKIPQVNRPMPFGTDILAPNITDGDVEGLIASLDLGTPSGSSWQPNYLYLFNRKLQTVDTEDVGGELLDVVLEASLPQVVAVQAIAGVGGQMQRGTLNSIDIETLRKISLYDVFPKQSDNKCPDNSPCSQESTPTPARPTEVPVEFSNAIRAALEARTTTYRNQEFTASSIESTKQTLIDEWKGGLAVCKEPATSVSEEEKQRLQKLCEKEVRERTQLYDDYIGGLRNARRETYEANRPGYLELVKQYSGMFGMAIDLIEYDVSKLTSQLDREAVKTQKENKPHPFNSSNLTKTLVNLTMPGIGGIQLWQSFGVERVPSILDRGYYVVTKINHEFNVDTGWITKIQGRFRYNPDDKEIDTRESEQPCADRSRTRAVSATVSEVAPPSRTTAPPNGTRTLSAEEQQQRAATTSKPVDQFTNAEIVSRTNAILGLITRPRFGSIASRDAYDRRVADGIVNRLRSELILLDDEATKRVRALGSIPRELRGSYVNKLENRLEERNIRLRG